jgi:hypothetical protein
MSETTKSTASELPPEPQSAPAFITVKGEAAVIHGDTKGRAVVTVDPDRDTPEIVHLRVTAEPYDAPGCSVAVRVILPAGKVARKLRRLATFHRDQQRLGPEMDVEDELRAMQVLAKTLDSLDEDARSRVLEWLRSRTVADEMRKLRGARAALPPYDSGVAEVARLPIPIARERRMKKRGCEGKTRFASMAQAQEQMDALYRVGKAQPETLNAYRCRFCRWHHVGHRAGSV